jgi:DNA repair protein RadC
LVKITDTLTNSIAAKYPESPKRLRLTRRAESSIKAVPKAVPKATLKSASKQSKERPLYEGHRQRLRQRFRHYRSSLHDYEILELFLFFCIPYKDTKPLAKTLLKTFKTFEKIFFATESQLCALNGIGIQTALALNLLGEIQRRCSRQEFSEPVSVLSSWDSVLQYCKKNNAYGENEAVHVLFLNRKNHLITDEIVQSGTVGETPFYVRNILKRALELNASSLIVAHNHPSGDPTPSKADIENTRMLAHAARSMGIIVHDHFILTPNAYTSLRNLGVFDDEP